MKKFALWFVVLILCMPLSIAAAAPAQPAQPAQPAKAVETEEIGVFVNGEYIVSTVKALKIGSKNYLPVKVISSLPNIKVEVDNGKTVITGTKDSIVIVKNQATLGSTKQAVATELVGNYTYIAIGDLGKIHELGVKVLANSGTVLLWTDATGKQNSNRIINGVYHTKETRFKEGIGKKVYFYGSSKSDNYGWLVDIDADKSGTYSITYLLKNGKLIEDSYFNYTEMLTTPEHNLLQSYVGKTLWVYRDAKILNNSPLKNIEKLKVVSIVLNSDSSTGMTMKFKRVDGSTVNQRIPLDPSEEADYYIQSGFFREDPHVTFKASKKVWESIYKRSVMKGMTKEQAVLAWGVPDDVNVYGDLEQWVYNVGQYLYFEKGLVYSWQNYK